MECEQWTHLSDQEVIKLQLCIFIIFEISLSESSRQGYHLYKITLLNIQIYKVVALFSSIALNQCATFINRRLILSTIICKVNRKMKGILDQIKKAVKDTGEEPENLLELDLTGIKIRTFSTEMKKYLDKFKSLQNLVLAQCDLVSLDNLPDVPLTTLDISSNQIQDKHLKILKKYKKLNKLILSDNKIDKFDSLRSLAENKNLEWIQCQQNPIEHQEQYKTFFFETFKSLLVQDRVDREGNAVEDEDGEFDEEEQDGGEERSEGEGQEQEGSSDEEFEGQVSQQDEQDEQESQQEEEKPRKKRK